MTFVGGPTLSISTLLVILALIVFVLAAIGFGWKKTDLIAVGLALWALSQVIDHLSNLNIHTILLILAFIAFVGAAIGYKYRKVSLIAVGLALWMLSLVLTI
jgi:hypothetical protein